MKTTIGTSISISLIGTITAHILHFIKYDKESANIQGLISRFDSVCHRIKC